MKLINENNKGKYVISGYGRLKFDENGVLTEPELTEEALKALAKLNGFTLEGAEGGSEKQPDEDKESTENEDKTPEKEDEKPEDDESPANEPEKDIIDFEDMTADEMKDAADKRGIEVEGTGRKGSVLKKDLEKALQAHNDAQ